MDFEDFFRLGSCDKKPRPCQIRLAEHSWPETWVVPTGFGKTAAVLAAWLWKIAQVNTETPRRLVYCLPMRTLVEQTGKAAKDWLTAAETAFGLKVEFDVLMGGCGNGQRGLPGWVMHPERPAILVGTQDILISAALMRGYGASRYRWPVDFALLNNDAFWIFDEVQLTGAALTTSAQLEGFRRQFGVGRGCRTMWMSATLDPAWLRTVDFAPTDEYRPHDLTAADLIEVPHLWAAKKSLTALKIDSADLGKKAGLKTYVADIAKKVLEKTSPQATTIAFFNTVRRAQAVFEDLKGANREVILVHSRFRKADRDERMKQLGERPSASGRIIVATQALEAGVDVTCATMITEIAPWSSLVQRFGRCNRYGECGEGGADISWVDLPDTEARPYTAEDFESTRGILRGLSACGPSAIGAIRPSAPLRGAVIRKRDLFDLFDTDPDLSGFDVDVSLYVRDADDTDVRLFWRPVKENGPMADAAPPASEEMCPAPLGGAKELLKRKNVRGWRWDALTRQWRRTGAEELFPGMTLWIDAESGGYDAEKGFDPAADEPVESVASPLSVESEPSLDSDPDTTTKVSVSLIRHSAHALDRATRLAELLGVSAHFGERDLDSLIESALWHDLGKAHDVFKARCGLASDDAPLAKTPNYDWRRNDKRNRQYFRHELASALAYLAVRQWGEEASLAAYLIAAHHGKVRMRLRALPKERCAKARTLFARGIFNGDVLPETNLHGFTVPATTLDLDIMQLGEGRCGPSWAARTQGLLKQYGPFRLAWLEALLRVTDWQASAAEEETGHDDL